MFPGITCANTREDFQCDTQVWLLPLAEPFPFAGAEVTDSKAGNEAGAAPGREPGERRELLLALQTGHSWAHPALGKEGQSNPPGTDVKQEKGMSGEARAVCGAALLPSFPAAVARPRGPGGAQPRRFLEQPGPGRPPPVPRTAALRDASGNSRCHSKHGKRAPPLT